MERDTHPEALEVLRRRTAGLTMSQRVEEGLRASVSARRIMRAGIRARHPAYTEHEIEDALARMLWGDELFRRVYPDRPLLDP